MQGRLEKWAGQDWVGQVSSGLSGGDNRMGTEVQYSLMGKQSKLGEETEEIISS